MQFKFKPMFSQSHIQTMTDRFQERTLEKLIVIMTRAGEFFVDHARRNGDYNNRTGNLRSSIGYVVSLNGIVINMSDFTPIKGENLFKIIGMQLNKGEVSKTVITDYSGQNGSQTGMDIATDLASKYPNGLVLIGVAGMEYGKYVEANGYDVITGASIATEAYVKANMAILIQKINSGK